MKYTYCIHRFPIYIIKMVKSWLYILIFFSYFIWKQNTELRHRHMMLSKRIYFYSLQNVEITETSLQK